MADFPMCSNRISLLLLLFFISKLEARKGEVKYPIQFLMHLSYTVLAKVPTSSQLHSFQFPDVSMLQGQN